MNSLGQLARIEDARYDATVGKLHGPAIEARRLTGLDALPNLVGQLVQLARDGDPALHHLEHAGKVRIDALDITVLRGGPAEVGKWAIDHGFRLPPDSPEVLDFYAARSPIFLAAVFDADAATERGQAVGDGTPVHLTIPTDNPWVPLRILALGKTAAERVEADVYLLTDQAPALLPTPDGSNGLQLGHSAAATESLLTDLRSDRGMDWVPSSGWLTKVRIDAAVPQLGFDLAIDASGAGQPSRVMAGFDLPGAVVPADRSVDFVRILIALTFSVGGVGRILHLLMRRPPLTTA